MTNYERFFLVESATKFITSGFFNSHHGTVETSVKWSEPISLWEIPNGQSFLFSINQLQIQLFPRDGLNCQQQYESNDYYPRSRKIFLPETEKKISIAVDKNWTAFWLTISDLFVFQK